MGGLEFTMQANTAENRAGGTQAHTDVCSGGVNRRNALCLAKGDLAVNADHCR